MTETQNILLIILATSHIILLVLCIVAVSFVIKILRSIRNISTKVEGSVEDISSTIEAVGDKLKPVLTTGIIKFVMRLINKKK